MIGVAARGCFRWGSVRWFTHRCFFGKQGLSIRAVALASVVPLAPAIIFGNFTELRLFNEFIPIMACLLATTMVPPDRPNVGNAGAGAFWRCLLRRLR